jgi:hypothetical protein
LKQIPLLPKPKPHIEDVSISTIKRRPTLLRAFHLAQEVSGLEDKEIYGELDIDPSHWTRIKNGTASLPSDERFVRFFDVVHNEVPLIWLAESRGYDWTTIRKHRSDVERRLEEVERENADLRRSFALILNQGKSK